MEFQFFLIVGGPIFSEKNVDRADNDLPYPWSSRQGSEPDFDEVGL
jgi:hypothetical protein